MKYEVIRVLLVLTGLTNLLMAAPQERAAQNNMARFADFSELRIESIEPVDCARTFAHRNFCVFAMFRLAAGG
jgi:hypothetical protein